MVARSVVVCHLTSRMHVKIIVVNKNRMHQASWNENYSGGTTIPGIPQPVSKHVLSRFLEPKESEKASRADKIAHSSRHPPCFCGIAFTQSDHIVITPEHLKSDTLCVGLEPKLDVVNSLKAVPPLCRTYCENAEAMQEFIINFVNSLVYIMVQSTQSLNAMSWGPGSKIEQIDMNMPFHKNPDSTIVASLIWDPVFSRPVKIQIYLKENNKEIARFEKEGRTPLTNIGLAQLQDYANLKWRAWQFTEQRAKIVDFCTKLFGYLGGLQDDGEYKEIHFQSVTIKVRRRDTTPDSDRTSYFDRNDSNPLPQPAGVFKIRMLHRSKTEQKLDIQDLKAKLVTFPLTADTGLYPHGFTAR